VFLDLLPLIIFRFSGFVAFNFLDLLNGVGINAGFHIPDFVVPIGISFTTFRAISYLVDLYRGEAREANILDLGIFMSFFPYMAAGPITRMGELLPQLRLSARRQKIDATRALYLIALGLAKKLIISDYLARTLTNDVFATPGQFSAIDVIIGIHAYAVQIYCDFSGYTDMAIGVALLLGFNLPLNFNRPYTAVTAREFWRRWHMTLSRWIRDYLYIPLGGSRKGSVRTYVNVMIAMILAGLWHGAGWTFVVWGALHGIYQVVEHRLEARRKGMGLPPRELKGARLAFRRLVTLELVCLGWVFFRADSIGDAFAVIGRTFTGWATRPEPGFWVILAIVIGIGFQYLPPGLTSSGFRGRSPVATWLFRERFLEWFCSSLSGCLGPRESPTSST
jgi:D-alanyl-lipoteichoic acid acyltransferase DltB (MBOAT superfamily)